jgi:hypothetical protein
MLIESTEIVDGHSATFEDDGRVAYAYIWQNDTIVADVWLYNHGEPPTEPEWRDPGKLPFANPKGFASTEPFAPVTDESEVTFSWFHSSSPSDLVLSICIRGELIAKLTPGSKPGWCRLAVKDGPLALQLKDSP